MKSFFRYLAFGSDELFLPKDWLANRDRLARYEAYTKRQWWQGSVTKDVAAMKREQFWQRHSKPLPKVAKFPACRV